MQAGLEIIQTPEKAAALFEPQRVRLLELLAEPDSAAGLARRLDLSRQQVNYHLHALERAQLIQLVAERKKGNCMERLMQATARWYLISPEVLGALLPAPGQDRFSAAYLAFTAARTIAELASLRVGADRAGKRLATLTLSADVRFASPMSRAAFAEEMTSAFASILARYQDDKAPGGRTFRVFIGGYPAPTKTEDAGTVPARLD